MGIMITGGSARGSLTVLDLSFVVMMLGVLSQLCCILLRGALAPQIKLDFVYS